MDEHLSAHYRKGSQRQQKRTYSGYDPHNQEPERARNRPWHG
jgi:hypothetical protein